MTYKMSFFSLPAPVMLLTVLICVLFLFTFDFHASAQELQTSDTFGEMLSMAYSIERRFSGSEDWATIASFELSQRGFGTPARLQNMVAPPQTLSNEQRKQLGETIDFIFYRVVPSSSDKQERASFPTIAVSPCTIIRGFSVLGKTTLVLTERLKVVSHSGVNVVGLQVSSTTNVFQASMDGDTCDRSIVVALFPNVEMVTEVGLVSSLSVRKVRYDELGKLTSDRDSKDVRKGSSKSQTDSLDDEDSIADDYDEESNDENDNANKKKKNDKEEKEEEKTFLQKYWLYLVLPFVFSFIRGGASGASQRTAAPQGGSQ